MKNNIINYFSKFKSINNYYTGVATILVLHRVCPFRKNELSSNRELKISPCFLEKFILELKRKGYDIISLDRLHEILINGEKVEKKIIFTLDDGYEDNYTHAYPIFSKYNIPFTIYITTSFPERQGILWWYVIEDILFTNNHLYLSNGLSFQCESIKEKEAAFLQIRKIIMSFSKEKFVYCLSNLFDNYNIDWHGTYDHLMMNWHQIKYLGEDSLCTIGGHTLNHFSLNKLTEKEIEKEVLNANMLLENKIGHKIEHFAYPFGGENAIGKRECNIVKGLGIKTATTTRSGNIFLKHKYHLECLPRINLWEKFTLSDIGRMKRKRIVCI